MVFREFKKIFIFCFFLFFYKFKQSNFIDIPYINLPYALFLLNDNIFVIHQNGVSIYDSNFNKLIKNEIIFSESEKTEYNTSFSRLTVSQFRNGYIISIINDKIYFFDYKGSLIFESTEKIIDNNIMPYYYTLVPFKFFDDYYFYIIGFVYNGVLNIYNYKYQLLNNNNNTLISRLTINDIKDDGLSCQIMNSNFNDKILVCFLIEENRPNKILVYFFSISETNIQNKFLDRVININELENIKYIKSICNFSGTKSFICFYEKQNSTYCFKYDINDLSEETVISRKRRIYYK